MDDYLLRHVARPVLLSRIPTKGHEMMNPEAKAMWLEDLRDPNNTQATGFLHVLMTEYNEQGEPVEKEGFCCLGLLSRRAAQAGACVTELGDRTMWYKDVNSGAKSQMYLALPVIQWAGMEDHSHSGDFTYAYRRNYMDMGEWDYKSDTLANLNDDGFTFAQIADVVERFF